MTTIPSQPPVSDMLVTVKAREIQRATMAEMRRDAAAAARHFLAAAHLEMVLAEDYAKAGQDELALRSRLSAASCLWRGGRVAEARDLLDALTRDHPAEAAAIREVAADLEKSDPAAGPP